MDRTFVALDLETTGLAPRIDRMIEVGAVRFRGDEVLATFQSLVRPEVGIPRAVQELTGIRDADVAAAPQPEEVLTQLIDFVGESAVVAHSGNFDLSFLVDGEAEPRYELFDTLDLARIMLPMAPSHSLPHLSRQLGLTHPHPHRALSDADAARQLFRHLRQVARGFPSELIDRMLEVSAEWPHPLRHFLEEAHAAGRDAVETASRAAPQPVDVKGSSKPSTDPQAIRALLGPDGPMAARLDDYELRESQLQMTLAIAQLYSRGGRLLVEAGPGTGKSLAYLVPAVHHAVASGERVVVATNTITLQEQLFWKDIPFLRSWLPFDFKASLLKGRANYVSLRRWNRYLNAPSRRADGGWFHDELKFKLRMLVWLAQTRHGDRSEIKLNGLDELFWLRAASTPDDCLAAHCDNFKTQRCFYWNGRRAAQDADVIVTNHALLLTDALAGGTVLPAHEHLIVDEAHQLEETAVEALTLRVGETELLESIDGILTWFRAAMGQPGEPVKKAAADFRAAVSEFFHEARKIIGERQPLVPLRASRDEPVVLDETNRKSPDVVGLAAQASALGDGSAAFLRALDDAGSQLPLESNPYAEREFDLFVAQLKSRIDLVMQALLQPRADRLYWLGSERRSGRPVLHAAPTAAGRELQARAFTDKETVVFTSATLAVADSFTYFKRGVGLEALSAHEMVLASPFDYLSQALLCLPTDLRQLDDPAFVDQVATVVGEIGEAIDGRTLVLFTSHQQLRDVAERLRIRTAHSQLAVLAQNLDGTRRQLLAEFQDNPRSILLGSSSFWEGIDVPGDALSCVIIVRLPFKVPTDPLQLARSATLADPFGQLALPEAVLRLKQGFGRLIRRQSDRGAVLLMDHRIANRTYGGAFLDALPRAAVHVGESAEMAPTIARWLRRPGSVELRQAVEA
ncbi:MAG TPA: helicase C-terminal domain-containing protein [Candidatus Dormibacteraeota bacterium]|nr:helicase C-terminal domain-containing protein [Candidatus Dormibacteraeota bacterium]